MCRPTGPSEVNIRSKGKRKDVRSLTMHAGLLTFNGKRNSLSLRLMLTSPSLHFLLRYDSGLIHPIKKSFCGKCGYQKNVQLLQSVLLSLLSLRY